MYLKYFGFNKPPFRLTPDTESFYTGGDRGAVFRAIRHSILSGDPIIKVIGEVGSGKTMLCRMLETDLTNDIDIAYLANPHLTPDNVLQAIAFELNLSIDTHEASSHLMMLKTLHEHLIETHSKKRQVVVFIEEAQSMPLETLEEIRLLSNLETNHSKVLQIVLFGQPELDAALNQNHVRQIRDRITQNFYLKNLDVSEISDYLLFRLYSSGYQGQHLFNKSTMRHIQKASQGLLRRINIIADKALLSCFSDSKKIVGKKQIKSAINDAAFVKTSAGVQYKWFAPALSFALVLSLGFSIIQQFGPNDKTQFDVNLLPPTQAGFPDQAKQKIPSKNETGRENYIITHPISDSTDGKKKILSFTSLRKLNTKKWINSVNPNHFSIQVLLTDADSVTGLESFLRQKGMLKVLGKIYIYDTELRGIPMTGVLYGEFTSYSLAHKALKELPAPLRRYRPYIRNIRNVIAEKLSDSNGIKRDSS